MHIGRNTESERRFDPIHPVRICGQVQLGDTARFFVEGKKKFIVSHVDLLIGSFSARVSMLSRFRLMRDLSDLYFRRV